MFLHSFSRELTYWMDTCDADRFQVHDDFPVPGCFHWMETTQTNKVHSSSRDRSVTGFGGDRGVHEELCAGPTKE